MLRRPKSTLPVRLTGSSAVKFRDQAFRCRTAIAPQAVRHRPPAEKSLPARAHAAAREFLRPPNPLRNFRSRVLIPSRRSVVKKGRRADLATGLRNQAGQGQIERGRDADKSVELGKPLAILDEGNRLAREARLPREPALRPAAILPRLLEHPAQAFME